MTEAALKITDDPHARHRVDFKEFVEEKAERWHRHYLGHLFELIERWSRECFDGLLPPYVLLSSPSSARALGDCSSVSSFGGRTQIRIRPSLITGTHPRMRDEDEFEPGRLRFIEDVALHESVHAWVFDTGRDPETGYHGHGPVFRDKCNEIGKALGLPPVRTSKKRGKDAHLPSCAEWPHCVRPRDPDYYEGAWIWEVEKPEDDTDALEIAKQSIEALDAEQKFTLAEWMAWETSDPWVDWFEEIGMSVPDDGDAGKGDDDAE